jgi:hypothetical protein
MQGLDGFQRCRFRMIPDVRVLDGPRRAGSGWFPEVQALDGPRRGCPASAPVLARTDHDRRGRPLTRKIRRGRRGLVSGGTDREAYQAPEPKTKPARLGTNRSRSARAATAQENPARPARPAFKWRKSRGFPATETQTKTKARSGSRSPRPCPEEFGRTSWPAESFAPGTRTGARATWPCRGVRWRSWCRDRGRR